MVFVLSACSRVGVSPSASSQHPTTLATHPLVSADHNQIAVLSADYVARYGEVTVANVSETDPSRQLNKAQYPVSGDPALRWFSEIPNLFVVNRQGADNIQTFGLPSLDAVIPQFSLVKAEGLSLEPNLQDIAVKEIGGGALVSYVSALDSPRVIKTDGISDRVIGSVDLSAYADSDGLPEAALMAWVNDQLWIELLRMDRGKDLKKVPWATTDHSSVVVVDPTQDKVVTEIKLVGKDPMTNLKPGPDGRIYVGSWGGMDPHTGGGMEAIDPVAKQTAGLLADETALGGKPFDFDFGGGAIWILVETPSHKTQLIRMDWPSFSNRKEVKTADDIDRLQSVVFDPDRNLVFLASREQKTPGIIILDPITFNEVCFFSVGAPPLQMVWLGKSK
jgi:hypothetical protein